VTPADPSSRDAEPSDAEPKDCGRGPQGPPLPGGPTVAPPDGATDSELMAAVAAGDRAAFELVYGRYAPPIMAFLHHLSFDRGLAEDAMQETFVRVWKAASRFRPGARLAPWLYRIAQRAAWTAGAARARRGGRARGQDPAEATDGALLPSRAAPVDAPARDQEAAEALRKALGGLSEALRVAFVLVRMEGLSYEDAAEVLEVPVGTVKSRVAAAETHLRGDLRGFS